MILGLCLPLAILLGYLLAEPMESSTLTIVVMVLGVLLVPFALRWHHAFLVFSWGASINLGFLPGRPQLWMLMALVSLLLAVLTRAVHPERKFLLEPKVIRPLGCLMVVVLVTAALTGGLGVSAIGSDRVGGRGYFYMLAAVLGYFALTSQPIPLERARLYVALFFLSGLTAMISNLIYYTPQLYFLYYLFQPEMAVGQAMGEYAVGDFAVRVNGLMISAVAINFYLLARYGLTGVFDLRRPWRMALFLAAGFASTYGGFRSAVLFQVVLIGVLFVIEGLWRTRYFFIAVCAALLVGIALVSFVDRMPLSVQRSVSFLPINVDPVTKQSAIVSTEWRLEIWRTMLPEVPKYLFKGKGYTLDPRELGMMADLSPRGGTDSAAMAAFAGDYHSGPLSVVIPFGIYGVLALVWFLAAGIWVLRRNFRHGDPALYTINAVLLACFITRVIFFFFVFGALYSDLYNFTGLIGLSIALNGGVRRVGEEPDALQRIDNHSTMLKYRSIEAFE